MSEQILLVDYRANITKTLKLDLLKYFDLSAVVRESQKDALAILEILPQIKILLVLAENAKEKTLESIQKHLLSQNKNLEIVSYLENETAEAIIQKLGDHIGKPVEHSRYLKDHSHEGYRDVPLHFLKNIDESPVDLYIQIGSGAESRFLKRINKLDTFSSNMIPDFHQQGIHCLFVQSQDFDLFMTSLSNSFVEKLTASNATVSNIIDAQFASYNFINTYSSTLNFDKNVVEVVESTIESYLKVLSEQKSIAHLIQQVVGKKSSISFQGFYLTCLLSNHVLKVQNKLQETRMQKLIMAALFCDYGIEKPEAYLVSSNTQLLSLSDQDLLTSTDIEHIRSHAKKNADLLKDYPELPLSVLSMIRHHHGSPDGIGFHDIDNPQLEEDDLILLSTHLFIQYFLTPQYKYDKKEILKVLRERFSYDRIRPYWDAIGAKIE